MSVETGTILLKKYRVEHLLGEGAYGKVYLATDIVGQAPWALKIVDRKRPGLSEQDFNLILSRYQTEYDLSKEISNPHLVKVYDFKEVEENLLILVMEYCSGGTLAQKIQKAKQDREPLSIDQIVRIALEVAAGLGALHSLEYVHRDIKPSNILFSDDGKAKITDVGLTQMPGNSERDKRSNPGNHPGTPGYMSPEQETLQGYLSPSSDIYSLGLTLFKAITGRQYQMVKPGTHARLLRADVPEWLDALVAQMLDKDPQKRPWNGSEVMRLIREGQRNDTRRQQQIYLQEKTTAESAKVEQEKSRRQKRGIWIAVGIGLPVVLLTIGFVITDSFILPRSTLTLSPTTRLTLPGLLPSSTKTPVPATYTMTVIPPSETTSLEPVITQTPAPPTETIEPSTAIPSNTQAPVIPTDTQAPLPTATTLPATPVPSNTPPPPLPTNTPVPPPTNTAEPPPTNTPVPPPTDTPVPPPTDTPSAPPTRPFTPTPP